jgi:hypothetical protein
LGAFLQRLGYRKIWYHTFDLGLGMADFWTWEFSPDLPQETYHDRNDAAANAAPQAT